MKNGSAKLLLRDTGKEQGAGPNSTWPELKENLVTFNNRYGVVARHPLLRIEASSVVFEIYQTNFEFKISDQLENFKVFVGENLIYNGRAMVTNIFSIGLASGCEVQLDQPGIRFVIKTPDGGKISIKDCHQDFFKQWQQNSKILPEFKLAVIDFQHFLWDLKNCFLNRLKYRFMPPPCQPSRGRETRGFCRIWRLKHCQSLIVFVKKCLPLLDALSLATVWCTKRFCADCFTL